MCCPTERSLQEIALRTVIIGATGHIGTWLVPRLVRAGHDVVAVSRGIRRPYHDAVEWNSVQRVTMDRVLEEHDGTFARSIAGLHAEAVVDLTCFDPVSAMHLVQVLRDRVGVFVHCGTLWVHGTPATRPYDEKAPRHPFGDYGIRKAQVERVLLDAADGGFPAILLHPGHISGPGWLPINPAGHLDKGVFDALADGGRVTLVDDGMATLQHVHADDVAQAFELALLHRDVAVGEAFHVAAAAPVTMRAYAEAVASWFGREARLTYLPWEEWLLTVGERDAELTRDHMLHSPCASIGKARAMLGFEPRFTALAAVRDALTPIYPSLA